MKKLLTLILAIAVMTSAFTSTALAALDNALYERTVTLSGDVAPYNQGFQLRKAYDGDISSLYISKTNGEAKTIIVDLGVAKEIDSINILYDYTTNWYLDSVEVYPGCADGTYDFLETPVYSATPVVDATSKTYFLGFDEAVTARYFKLVLTPNSTASLRIKEIEFFNRTENLLTTAEIELTGSLNSNSHPSFPVELMFDGSLHTRWATSSKNNTWTIAADFGSEKTVNYLDMTDVGETVTGVDIYASADGTTYNATPDVSITRTITGIAGNDPVPLSYSFAPVTARYIKVVLKPVSTKSITIYDFGLYTLDYQEQFEKDIEDTVIFESDGDIIASVSDGVLSADITVSNSSSNTSYPITYIMAVWDGNKLIDTQTYNGTVAAGGTTSFTLTSVDTSELENVEVNLYRWDTTGKLVPYTRVYDLPESIRGEGKWTVAGGINNNVVEELPALSDADLETGWTPATYNATGFINYTLDSAKTVNTMRIVQGANSAITSFTIEYSNDNKTWERAYDANNIALSAAADEASRISFAPVTAKYFRIYLNKQTANYEICEIELLNEVY